VRIFSTNLLYKIILNNSNFLLQLHTMCYVVYAIQVFLIFFVVHVLAPCSHNLDRVMTEEHFA